MKKLLFVNNTLSLGGIEKSLIEILNDIDFSAFEVDLLIFDPASMTCADAIDKRVRLITPKGGAPMEKDPLYRIFRFLRSRSSGSARDFFARLSCWSQYRKCVSLVKHTVYHTAIGIKQDSPSVFVSRPFVHADKKILFFRHGSVEHPQLHVKPYQAVDTIIAVTDGVERMLRERYPFAAEKIITLPDPVRWEEVRRKADAYVPDCPKDRLLLCSCGRLSEEKGFLLAVRAARLLKEQGVAFRWYFVGDGPQKQSLQEEIRRLGLEREIVLTGMLDNPFPYFKLCDLYVQPSYVEADGRTIREAMVLRKPVISTRTLGGEFNIRHNQNGWLTDISPEALAEGIRELAQNDALRQRIVETLTSIDYTAHNEAVKQRLRQLYE